jgi:hypothetical protein
MNPKIRGLVNLGQDILSKLDVVERPSRSLAPGILGNTLRKLDEAQDWGAARTAFRGVRDKLDGADQNQIDQLLAALNANLNRLKKQNPEDGAVWKSTRGAAEQTAQEAVDKAQGLGVSKSSDAEVDKLVDKFLARLKSDLGDATAYDDVEALSETVAGFENTSVFQRLVKEGLAEAISEKTVSNLVSHMRKEKSVKIRTKPDGTQELVLGIDDIFANISPAVSNVIKSNDKFDNSIRAQAAKERVRLLKFAYDRAGKAAKNDPVAASERLALVDDYIVQRMTRTSASGAPLPAMFTQAQRNALAIARTKAFGSIQTSPMYGQTFSPRPAAAPQSARRAMGPVDADPLAQPLSRPLPEEFPYEGDGITYG